MDVITGSEEETEKKAWEILKKALKNRGDSKKASVITFSGDLGSGKTVLVKGVAKALGVKERVLSPTFVIERRYKLKGNSNYSLLIHIDAYRLSSADDLKAIDWERSILSPDNIICLEWPENVLSAIPQNSINVHLEVISESERLLKY